VDLSFGEVRALMSNHLSRLDPSAGDQVFNVWTFWETLYMQIMTLLFSIVWILRIEFTWMFKNNYNGHIYKCDVTAVLSCCSSYAGDLRYMFVLFSIFLYSVLSSGVFVPSYRQHSITAVHIKAKLSYIAQDSSSKMIYKGTLWTKCSSLCTVT
jgi:hypothetical protein